MSNSPEAIQAAIDTIYDAKAGKFRGLSGEVVTPDSPPGEWPKKGDLIYTEWGDLPRIQLNAGDWVHGDHAIILRRAEQPDPDLIYFPWPSGIDGIIGVIGPRGDIPKGTGFIAYGDNGMMVPNRYFLSGTEQVDGNTFRFPADADLTWVRSEDEVPADLLKEAKEREQT